MRFQQAPYRIADVVALLFILHGNTSFGSLAPIIPYRSCKHYLAQAEIEKKEKRQREGIAAKKLRGEWDDYGRPAVMSRDNFAAAYARVEAGEITPTELRRELKMSHATFYRYRSRYISKNG